MIPKSPTENNDSSREELLQMIDQFNSAQLQQVLDFSKTILKNNPQKPDLLIKTKAKVESALNDEIGIQKEQLKKELSKFFIGLKSTLGNEGYIIEDNIHYVSIDCTVNADYSSDNRTLYFKVESPENSNKKFPHFFPTWTIQFVDFFLNESGMYTRTRKDETTEISWTIEELAGMGINVPEIFATLDRFVQNNLDQKEDELKQE